MLNQSLRAELLRMEQDDLELRAELARDGSLLRLVPGGTYEMATLELREDSTIDPETVRMLTRAAVTLNEQQGDPTRSSHP